VAFERRFGIKHLYLACHAALPLILTPELVNLIRINFLDSENIHWIAESDFLLSPLCRPIDEAVFEVEPSVREVLLVELENQFGWKRPFELAEFLKFYLHNQPDWKQRPELTLTQKWIAQAYLKPDGVIEDMLERLNRSLPEEKPVSNSSGLQIATALEILAEPLERTNLWGERQYLLNSSRALAQILYGDDEDLREKIREEIESGTGEEGILVLSPVIRQWLTDVKINPIAMGCAVILTALPVEYMAVRAYLTDLQEETHPQGTIYERGKFAANGKSWDVGIVEINAGNSGAVLEAEQAIAYFKPSVVMFVGVAGGIKDVALGDVVAATKVYGYEWSRAKRSFEPRPDVGLSAYNMIQRARAEAKKSDWLQRLASPVPTPPPRVFIAPIAAGEKVVASTQSSVWKFLQSNYGDAVAVEMEGRDLLQAAHANQQVSALIIRGISDLVHGMSEADVANSQKTAARHASAFAFEILAKLEQDWLDWLNDTTSSSKRKTQPTLPNFFAYDDAWAGRESLIQDFSRRLRGSCRLLLLVGITGIGKTALGERLAVELSDWFDGDWTKYLQENFDNLEQASDFASVAARWLEKWGELITSEDRQDTQRLLYRLMKHLQENRYLVQIDSLQNILQGNEEEGWSNFQDESWMKFFESFLKAESCQSRIILTSQDLPGQIEQIGTRYQNFWYCQPLSGLEESEQLALFEKAGLNVSTESEGRPYLERIGAAYEGHPLTLRVIAGEIRNKPFNGNVLAYWNSYGREIEEVEKSIEKAKTKWITASTNDTYQLDRYTTKLKRYVRSRLEKTFSRLDKEVHDAYLMLCEASVYRSPVPEEFWLSHLEDWERDEEQQHIALQALRDRYLVEEIVENNQCLLRQHNLIRSVSLERLRQLDDDRQTSLKSDGKLTLAKLDIDLKQLKKIQPAWKRMHYRAVINWLTKYKPELDASNLGKVRGYLEAFHHLCELEAWEAASQILFIRLNTPTNEELYKQLGTWGYYREQVDLCSRLLGKLNSSLDTKLLNILGNSYYVLGHYHRAIDYLEQSIAIAREIEDSFGEGNALLNLGNAYEALADYAKAIDYYQQSLMIARKIQDRQVEGKVLTNIGLVYENLGNYPQSINYSQQSLQIAREIGERLGEGQALGNLGNVYLNLGDYQRAIDYYQQYLAIAKEIGDRFGEERSIGTLGNTYYALGNYYQAIEHYQQSLALAREIQDRRGEGWVLRNLGDTYEALGDYAIAIDCYQQSLTLAQEIQDRRGEEIALGNLGVVYYSLGEYPKTIECNQQSLQIAREIGDRQGEGQALGNLGIAYQSLGDFAKAIQYHQQHLTIARTIGEVQGESNALGNLGNVYLALGDYNRAVEYHQQYLAIAQQIGDRYGQGNALYNLGNTLMQLGQYSEALEALQISLEIFREIGSRASEAEVLKGLAEVHQQLDHLDLALEFCDQALAIATELGVPLAAECQELKDKLVDAGSHP
jgi:tetratricopeptide (TPR) repeat protein